MTCVLCGSRETLPRHQDRFRSYIHCLGCGLIFVPRDQLMTFEDERKRYDTHENNEDDPRYREYLGKIAMSVLPHLQDGARGLDFGCGASVLLARIFGESGVEVDSFDIHYHPDHGIWEREYDFLVLSEVIEHLSDLRGVMERLTGLLSPQGQLFIKTKFYPESKEAFGNWFYKNDPTHIQFFNPSSMEALAQRLKMLGPETLPSPDLCRLWLP